VLRSECPPEQAERLLRLKELSEETRWSRAQTEKKRADVFKLNPGMDWLRRLPRPGPFRSTSSWSTSLDALEGRQAISASLK